MARSVLKDIDILGAYQVKGADSKTRERRLIIGAVILIAFLLLLLGYVKVQLDRRNIAMEAAALQEQLETSEFAQQSEDAFMIDSELAERLSYNEILSYHLSALSVMHRPRSDLFTDIERVAGVYGVTCNTLNYFDEGVALQCVSANASKAAEFAKALEAELLDSVTFYGYTLSEGDNLYGFSVQGIRKGAEQ